MNLHARIAATAFAALLLGAAAASPACSREPKIVPYEVVEQGNDSAFADKGPVLDFIPDEDRFGDFYAALHINRIPITAPPPVDFGSSFVFYVSSGRKMTGGYSIKVIGVRTWRRTLVIKAHLLKPLPDSYLTQMITNPYVLLSVPRPGTSGLKYDRVELHDWTGDTLFTLRFRPR
jgi:hypothetical protein